VPTTSEGKTRLKGRAIGVVYLLYFVTAFFGVFLTKGIVVAGDAAATATNILAHESLYRSGLAVDFIANALYIVLTAFLYILLEPVNRSVSLVAAFFGLVGCAVQMFGGLFRMAPLIILGNDHFLGAFTPEQLQAAALLFIRLHAQVFNVSLVCFALFDLLVGYLILRSTFLPRILGALLMCAGAGWLTFLWPPLATSLSSFIMPFGALAEILLMLWLLVKGVNTSGWQQKASAGL
jgi:hypothetical protein